MTRTTEWSTALIRDQVELYRRMWVLRLIDMALEGLHIRGLMQQPVRAGFGQEAVGIGATAPLRQGDICTTTHRPHAHSVGRGGPLGPAVADLMGNSCDQRDLVRESPLLGIGQAYSQWLAADGRVTLCVTEDSEMNSAHLANAAAMAVLWRLPIVLLVESVRPVADVRWGRRRDPKVEAALYRMASSCGMPSLSVDGHDVEAVRACVAKAVQRARAGEGPTLVEAVTSGTTDPLVVARRRLIAAGIGAEQLVEVEQAARRLVAEAVECATAMPPRADDDDLRPTATWLD